MLTIANIATMKIYDVTCDKFTVMRIYTSRNYG